MARVILGSAFASVLRAYGVWVSWEMNAELKEMEARNRGEGWVDQEMCEIEAREEEERERRDQKKNLLASGGGRPRSSSSSSATSHRRGSVNERRSNTLPLFTDLHTSPTIDGLKRLRSHTYSSSSSSNPQLVLVPCVLDSHGRPVYSPSSPTFTIPPYASPPRSRSSTSSYPPPSRSSSRASTSSKRSQRPRSSSSFSFSSQTHDHSPLASFSSDLIAFSDEPAGFDLGVSHLPSPPTTPTTLTPAAVEVEEGTTRRARSRSENDAASALKGFSSPSSSVSVSLPPV
jgi:hypothetical protein